MALDAASTARADLEIRKQVPHLPDLVPERDPSKDLEERPGAGSVMPGVVATALYSKLAYLKPTPS
jgi:hypothetical protein